MRGGHRTDRGNVRQLKEPINFQPLQAVNTGAPAEDVGGQPWFQVERVLLIVLLRHCLSVTVPRVLTVFKNWKWRDKIICALRNLWITQESEEEVIRPAMFGKQHYNSVLTH